ncbi:MFS transporter [Pseudonocardia humida]|uniref:MFS transporter n=1 Tax=Pseudonocardia humida TaxID=2800819 RepID=A0ABT0ZZ07_9PSEU|nr:MFS transporter [Pseudonocardia humida]MCO1655973.1 MFS transporter [Pseudonocardia humida]
MSARQPRAVLAVPEFRAIWLAELLSVLGDQLARVALTVLVFGRTGSASLAALSYALTFLPALVGGVLLAGLADRFRRREVMVAADALRALTVALMALPGMPLWLLCALLVLVVLAAAPHTAAQGALLPQVLPGRLYERGLAVRQITGQSAQLAGFAAGGLLVAAFTPEAALLVDAGTFVLSGLLVRFGVAARSRPRGDGGPGAEPDGQSLVGVVAEIAADPVRRALVALAWLVGCYVVPEALAAPYAAEIGAGPVAVGLLMAADPLGSVLGAWLFVRFVPFTRRARLVGVLAVAAGLPLLPFALRPDVPVAVVLLALSGMASTAYLLQTQAGFVRATPDGSRGRAIGIAASGIVAGQGVAVLVGGVLADLWGAPVAIAAAGAAGAVLALGGAVLWHRACRAGTPAATRAVTEG